MCNQARIRAYEEAEADPCGFLKQHYKLTPESAHEEIREQFTTFAHATGVDTARIDEAVENFCNNKGVAPFVLQAASAEQMDAYAHA